MRKTIDDNDLLGRLEAEHRQREDDDNYEDQLRSQRTFSRRRYIEDEEDPAPIQISERAGKLMAAGIGTFAVLAVVGTLLKIGQDFMPKPGKKFSVDD